MLQYTIYADLNCPFCYALHEQLHQFDLLSQIDWRLIEHASDIEIYNKTPESQAEMASDVFIVRSRAPSVEVALPRVRSDSRFANLCIIQAMKQHPEKAIVLRRLLYRALWVKGLDISDISVIYDCLIESGLPSEITIEEEQEELSAAWQKEWESKEVNLRIPVIYCSDGRTSLGLPSAEDLPCFFNGKEIETQVPLHETHLQSERQTIAIFCDHSLENLWPILSTLRNDFDILLPSSFTELKSLLYEDLPDLLLLSTEDNWNEMLSFCKEHGPIQGEHGLPIAFINPTVDNQHELSAYMSGAYDFLMLNRPPEILQARIKLLMQMKLSQDKLSRSARIDGLTQVNNRREFEFSIETEWRRALRSRRNLALIMLDIDYFKAFNDVYGHLAGDGCLRTVAQAIKSATQRAQDMVCRYGGEEFAVILPETTVEGAALMAERIRQAVASLRIEHKRSDVANIVTISIGIATVNPSHGGTPNNLIALADKGLYQAKERGRNQICVVSTE